MEDSPGCVPDLGWLWRRTTLDDITVIDSLNDRGICTVDSLVT
jgi:hypothetical protein